ncbi:MAG: aspartate/glutamate racemase family protein [Atribacterota bacterium]|nr:aspartate/glutamate racemase family protein [Atribacterota bacterium]MDD4896981.1 aspartate/glutamate racemase family protein [Atribacterota bacterium]MDD5636697.1 aspartate/glutamate racemase family protein [Atribacterota bacterium]
MKTIGLIGGMSWQSSAEYYRIINELVAKKKGGQHSCQCIMYSVDLDPILILRDLGEWGKLTDLMTDAAKRLEKSGADFLVICSNTMHKTVKEIQDCINIPILDIVDALVSSIKEKGLKRVGLLGTKFTMEEDFYIDRLKNQGLEVKIPEIYDRTFIHNVIYNELDFHILKQSSKNRFIQIIEKLGSNGVEGIILGCTEIPLLIKQEDTSLLLFDTTMIHATSAVDLALKES